MKLNLIIRISCGSNSCSVASLKSQLQTIGSKTKGDIPAIAEKRRSQMVISAFDKDLSSIPDPQSGFVLEIDPLAAASVSQSYL